MGVEPTTIWSEVHQMEKKTEKLRMRRYSKKTATNIYAAPMRA